MNKVESVVTDLVKPIISEFGYDLIDVDYVKEGKDWFLRVYIDVEGGIDIEQCADVSEKVSVLLDQEDPIKHEYMLEVSSPGVERPIKTKEEILNSVDCYVNVKLYEKINEAKEWEGYIVKFDEANNILHLKTKIKTRELILELPYKKISKIRYAVKF